MKNKISLNEVIQWAEWAAESVGGDGGSTTSESRIARAILDANKIRVDPIEYRNNVAIVACEFGYAQCEKGENVTSAIQNLMKFMS